MATNPDQDLIEDPVLEPLPGAEVDPLPPGVWLRYQQLSMAEGCAGNYRVVVYDDGRVFRQRNTRGDCRPPLRFTEPYPAQPTVVLAPAALAAIARVAEDQRFAQLAPGYRRAADSFDGAMVILELRVHGTPKRVIVRRAWHPAVDAIVQELWTHLPP